MVALTCRNTRISYRLWQRRGRFSGTQLHYSVDTVRYFRHAFNGVGDRLFFTHRSRRVSGHSDVEGIRDAAGSVRFYHCEPAGIRLEPLRLVIPPHLHKREWQEGKRRGNSGTRVAGGGKIAEDDGVFAGECSQRGKRDGDSKRANRRQSIHGMVSARVEEYILKQGLYR
jgi:hypothetical protein